MESNSGAVVSPAAVLPAKARSGRIIVALFATFAVLLVSSLFALRALVRTDPKPLPDLGELPNLGIMERNGDTLSLSSLQGKLLLIEIRGTDCGERCADRNKQLSEIQRYNASVAEDVNLITVIEGPIPPEQLTQLSKEAAAHKEWRWFTADSAAFDGMETGLMGTPETDIVLVDRKGRIRNRYSFSNREHRREMMLDSRVLLLEQPRSN